MTAALLFCLSTDRPAKSGASPLFQAAASGHSVTVDALACMDAELDTAAGPEQTTPLHAACYGGHTEVVRTLVARGAQLELQTVAGATPFFVACQRGHVDCARSATADPVATDNPSNPRNCSSVAYYLTVARGYDAGCFQRLK